MLGKLFSVLAFATVSSTNAANSDTLDVDFYFLNYLVAEAKKSQLAHSNCKYLSQDKQRFSEFVDFDKPLMGAQYTSKIKDKISVFIPISKPYRPGLVMTITLSDGECVGFELGEVMN